MSKHTEPLERLRRGYRHIMGQSEYNGKYEGILRTKDLPEEHDKEVFEQQYIDRRDYTRRAETSAQKIIDKSTHKFFSTFIIRYNQLHDFEQIRTTGYGRKFASWLRKVALREKLPLHEKCVRIALEYAINAHYNNFKDISIANYMRTTKDM